MNDIHPIIIKKRKKAGHGGHHGGAWKVAYADFVTAMMAFFLLMWLLNATSEEQRRGLSNYFGPAGDLVGAGGSGGVLGGLSLETEGNFDSSTASSLMDQTAIQPQDDLDDVEHDDSDKTSAGKTSDTKDQDKNKVGDAKQKSPAEKEAESQKQSFDETATKIKNSIKNIPDLKDLSDNLIIDQTPEGLRIQIVDQKNYSMFPTGGSNMYPRTEKLIQMVGQVISPLPNKISISGHTDSQPYAHGASYTNWELSTDRANATRRVLVNAAFNPGRILYVAGKSDGDPLDKSNPLSERNRRISIILHKNTAPLKDNNTPQTGKPPKS